MLGVNYGDLQLRAAGLNHFSVLLEARYTKSLKDAYPDILAKAPAFFEKELGYSDILEYYHRTGQVPETEGADERIHLPGVERSSHSWADRTLFKEILEKFKLLPITVDSHLGEYIGWAHSAADHKGILDFYALYRAMLAQPDRATIDMSLKERVIPIIEGIITDAQYEEEAVNILNKGLIPDLPSWIAVEVPATVGKSGIRGIGFPQYPKGFGALLRNYTGVYDLTAEAILQKKKEYVLQALLVNPVVPTCKNLESMVDTVLERQKPWLGYLR